MYHNTQGREIEALEGENMARDHQENLKHMQEWESEVIERVLDNDHAVDVSSDGSKFYVASPAYGGTRYHLVGKEYHGVTLDQVTREGRNSGIAQITIYTDEIPQLLKILLEWQFDQAREKIESAMSQQKASLANTEDDDPFQNYP